MTTAATAPAAILAFSRVVVERIEAAWVMEAGSLRGFAKHASATEFCLVFDPMTSNRPPVLAHERFAADRESFAGLDLAERFERIDRTNLWGAESSVPGLGSETPATAGIREGLPTLLQWLGARSLLDAPCGDAGWIGRMSLDVDYTGIDIVPSPQSGCSAG